MRQWGDEIGSLNKRKGLKESITLTIPKPGLMLSVGEREQELNVLGNSGLEKAFSEALCVSTRLPGWNNILRY